MKHQRTTFYARVGQIQIPQKRNWTSYDKLVFLHPMGYAGHVVHSGASAGAKRRCTTFHAWVVQMRFP
jgi:hypothetical protein